MRGGWRACPEGDVLADDVLLESVFDELREGARHRTNEVVWLAPPCSSFAVPYPREAARLSRTREEREGVAVTYTASLNCGNLPC